MIEQQKQNPKVSPVVQQALDKLNMRITDLLSQLNQVVRVLFEENPRIAAEFRQLMKENNKKGYVK